MKDAGVSFLPIRDAKVQSRIGLAYLRNARNPVLRRLLEALEPEG